jgi:heat shock protein HslJ
MIKRFLKLSLISFGLALFIYFLIPSLEDRISAQTWILLDARDFELIDTIEISLSFKDDVMSGNSGINQYSASYNLNGTYLHKTSLMVTEMASMDPKVNALEADYLKSLDQVKSILLEEDTLILINEVSEELLRYKAK